MENMTNDIEVSKKTYHATIPLRTEQAQSSKTS